MTSQLHPTTALKDVQPSAYVIKNEFPFRESTAKKPDNNKSLLILVIDDDFIMRKLLKTYLNGLGYQTATADNGEAGLSLAKQLHPHAILLDVMMPGMDGWSVLSAIKKDPELTAIPIIMVSIVEDKNIGELLGAAEYLIKPVRRNELNAILQKHLGSTVEKARVLLVEDDIVMQKLMAEMLTEAGWQVQTADNGLQAIEYLTLTHQPPQLILSDLIMPEMDGFELVTALRQSPVWQKIPIVILTSKHLTEDEQTLLNTQAANKIFQKNDYRIEELINEIQQCLTNISKSK